MRPRQNSIRKVVPVNVIAVASGKGGVGKTTFAANLGVALAASGSRVVLFDADLGLANLDVVLGVKSVLNIQHVVDGFASIPEVAVQGPGGTRVVTGGSGVSTMLRLSRKRLEALLSRTSELQDTTDVIIFDAASGVDAKIMTFLKFADRTILVTTPDTASIVDCYTTAKVLFRYKKDADVGVVVNRVKDEGQAQKVYETVKSAAWTFLRKPVKYLGSVREDPAAMEITQARKPFVTAAPRLPASKDIAAIAATIARALPVSGSKPTDTIRLDEDRKAA